MNQTDLTPVGDRPVRCVRDECHELVLLLSMLPPSFRLNGPQSLTAPRRPVRPEHGERP